MNRSNVEGSDLQIERKDIVGDCSHCNQPVGDHPLLIKRATSEKEVCRGVFSIDDQ